MVSFLVFSILFRLPFAMRIENSPSTCLWALSAKSNLGQIPWKGQYVYGIFSVSWYMFWLGRKEKGKSNRPGLTYVLTYVQVHTTNVNSWKVKTLDSSHFFLKGPCDVGIEWSIDRLIEAIWRKTKFQSKSAQLASVNLTWTNSRTCRQSLIQFVPLSFRRGDAQHRNSRVRTTFKRLSYWVNEGALCSKAWATPNLVIVSVMRPVVPEGETFWGVSSKG